MQTYAYGFPRLGENREFKKSIESFWAKRISEAELGVLLSRLEQERIGAYQSKVDSFPLGELTYYENILDTAFIFGAYKFKNLTDYFEHGRGKKALVLKKYFNTNYHYLVPSIGKNTKFSLSWNKPLSHYNDFPAFSDKPLFLIGPYTFLKLSHLEEGVSFNRAFEALTSVYGQLFQKLREAGIDCLHIPPTPRL